MRRGAVMHSLKEKVSDKFSGLFSGSSSSISPSRDQFQARPNAKNHKSVSSIFSNILLAANFDVFGSNKHKKDIKPVGSQPVRWKSKNLLEKEKSWAWHVDYDHKLKTGSPDAHYEDGEYSSAKSTEFNNVDVQLTFEANINHFSGNGRNFEAFEDATGTHAFGKSMNNHRDGFMNNHRDGFMNNLRDDSLFISSELYEFFEASLPNIVKGCQWVLLYSTVRDGISLRTLLRKSADTSGPCLLITGDKQGAVFGGLLEGPLKPTAKRKYQGTNQTFVFTTIYGGPRLFRPTGANRYFYVCLNDLLALGGGGKFALCLDGDLLNGTSGPCDTFGNLCLAHEQEFELKNVELWGFTHSSSYP